MEHYKTCLFSKDLHQWQMTPKNCCLKLALSLATEKCSFEYPVLQFRKNLDIPNRYLWQKYIISDWSHSAKLINSPTPFRLFCWRNERTFLAKFSRVEELAAIEDHSGTKGSLEPPIATMILRLGLVVLKLVRLLIRPDFCKKLRSFDIIYIKNVWTYSRPR